MRLDEKHLNDLLDTVDALTRERDEARAEAAGYLQQLQEDPLAKELASLTRERDEARATLAKIVADSFSIENRIRGQYLEQLAEARADLEAISSTAVGADSMVTELGDKLAIAEAAVAGAYRLASDAFKDEYSNHDNPLIGVMHGLKAINVLTPPDAIRAEKRLVAQAVLDEALWWHQHSRLCNFEWFTEADDRFEAALAAIEKETKDA